MNVAVLTIDCEEFLQEVPKTIDKIANILSVRGHDVKTVLNVTAKSDLQSAVSFVCENIGAVIVLGDIATFRTAFNDKYSINENINIFEIDNTIFIMANECTESFVVDTIIPALNSKLKTFYATAVFKTFGLKVDEIKTMLKDCIRNKNRIQFRFFESDYDCLIQIRYSSKTSKVVVDDIIQRTLEILKDYIYSLKNESLQEAVVDILKIREKKISLAESFTGGGLASAIVSVSGASNVLLESVVAYSNESKIGRLNVERQIVDHYGAVSIETVYEMAVNSLMDTKSDFAVATTGYASSTSEEENNGGEFFIAVGSYKSIDIDKFKFDGDRKTIIKLGINNALFRLYKKIKEDDFESIAKNFQAKE